MNIPFEFVGGNPSLDLVNTRMHRGADGGPDDLLETPGALRAWLGAAGLLSSEEVAKLDPELTLFSARRLRGALETLYFGLALGQADSALEERSLGTLNSLLEGGVERTRLERTAQGFERVTRFEALGPFDPTLNLARGAADFLQGLEPGRLKQCQGQGCDLLFYDETRNLSKRWCSMEGCGNRDKQARYRQRTYARTVKP